MNDEALAELVANFLARRESEPELAPEAFARHHADAPQLLPALQQALLVIELLDADGEPAPRWIGDCRVVREVGRGGMGVVYEVERGWERLALKQLTAAALLQPNARERLRREAAALQKVRHDGVVEVREVGEADGLPFVLMALVEGRSLADLGQVSWRTAADIAAHIAEALAAVHATGLFHRDLKPQNVVLAQDGRPVLLDFGLVHDSGAVTLTGTGDLLGTPRYLAPEQAKGAAVDARTDVFALGLVLAELLTGMPVREGSDRTSLLAEAHHGARPRLPASTPPALRHIVHRALARRPADRFQTAAAFAQELQRVRAGEPVHTRAPGPWTRCRDWLAFHPRAAGALAVSAVAVLALGAAAYGAQQRSAHAALVRSHFHDGVTAWVAKDDAALLRAAAATLALAADHAGARALQCLATGADSEALPEPVRAALAHRKDGRWPDAATALADASRLDPESPLLHVLLAEANGRAGNRDAAVADLTAAARLLPASAAMAAALGAAKLAARDAPGAVADFRAAVALEPASWRRRLQLARALHAVDAEAGLQEIAHARALLLDERPAGFAELLNLEASLLDKLGRGSEAVPLFRELVALEPQNARYAYNLAYALDRGHQVAEARTWYESALRLDPANQSAALCLAWLLATAAPPLADVERAESLLVATLARDHGRSEAVLQMVREFALRTGRTSALTAELTRLAAGEDMEVNRRATLQHTRAFVDNAAPKDRR